MEIGDRLEKR